MVRKGKYMKTFAKDIRMKYMYGFLFLTLCFVVDLIYLSNTTANVPMMDYWRFGKNFLYDIFNGGIKFSELWESINGQRAFLTYILFYFNVKFFHWNTRVAIYFGAIITYITGCICIYIIDKYEFSEDEKKDIIIKQILVIVIAMLLFNNVQWEIKVIEFYAPFAIITMFCILNFWFADRILCDMSVGVKTVWLYAILLGISICLVYSAFFPAVIGAICICGLINLVANWREQGIMYINKYIIVGFGIISASMLYMIGIEGISNAENNLSTLLVCLVNGDFLKANLLYLGSGVIHVITVEQMGLPIVYCLGLVIAVLYISSIIAYFKNRKEIVSYFPLMLIFYSLLTGALLAYGRGDVYGLEYMTSSRYAFQSKLGLIGVVLIWGCCLRQKEDSKSHIIKSIYSGMINVFVICLLLGAYAVENKQSPYRRQYYETCIEQMKKINECSEDGFNMFQANKDEIEITIDYMKKYRLGIFYYQSDTENSHYKSGFIP